MLGIWIPLTTGQFTLIDREDYEKITKHDWRITPKGYAISGRNYDQAYLHRFVLNLSPEDPMRDHKNRDKLDNRKENLRPANCTTNGQNRKKNKNSLSKYKGVNYIKPYKLWQARIMADRRICLGYFKTEEEAALAYNEAAKKYFGEFACLNEIGIAVSSSTI